MPEVRQGEEMAPGGSVSAASPERTNQCTLCWRRGRGWWLRESGLDACWAFLLFSEAGEERKVCVHQTVAAVLVAAGTHCLEFAHDPEILLRPDPQQGSFAS